MSDIKNRTNSGLTTNSVTQPMPTPPPPPVLSAGKPLVSIIVPVFNAEQYLSKCLDSLVAQTLREIEILCVNDGSTDSSADILDAYSKQDARVRVFTQENKGPGPARNMALDNVQGKYILFCDADDTIEPDAARECSAIAEKYSMDMVIFNARIIEVDRNPSVFLNIWGQPMINVRHTEELNTIDCIKNLGLPTVWSCLLRNDLIQNHNIRFPCYKINEDICFLYIVFNDSSIRVCPE